MQTHYPRIHGWDVRLRNGKNRLFWAVDIVETGRDIACQFQMLFLIAAHWHLVRAIQQNICRHQYRITKQTSIHIVGVTC
ncbi:Uncharacterised protein [Vibrio cholerae]|nr:Uncharacterised protein [Vibrio cholerae]CSC87665.1 Uncharacterised protein [Vibrio cholerae]CSD14881.1 Uncharacterised protein [Vibrio cholerae]CSI34075.1 Uncharacterised protein [Vibrio cholerae]